MTILIFGVDLGKDICSIVGLDETGAVTLRRRLWRKKLIGFASDLPACVVAMESCCGAHHIGRIFASQGHEVRLMPSEYVRPYAKAQKNDDRDAEAIAEAASLRCGPTGAGRLATALSRDLQEGEGDGLTVDRRPGSLVQKTASRRRVLYEDRTARSSILATVMNRETG